MMAIEDRKLTGACPEGGSLPDGGSAHPAERHEPDMFDADGIPVRVGDTGWVLDGEKDVTTNIDVLKSVKVARLNHEPGTPRDLTVEFVTKHGTVMPGFVTPSNYVHNKPKLDADGMRIEDRDVVYLVPGEHCGSYPLYGFCGGEDCIVTDLNPGGGDDREGRIEVMRVREPRRPGYPLPEQVTHRMPKSDSVRKIREDLERVIASEVYLADGNREGCDEMIALLAGLPGRLAAFEERSE